MPLAGSPFWFIGTELFATVIVVLAALELIADKLAKTPARIHAMPLVVRFATGGLSGAAVAFSAGLNWFHGLSLGAIGSLIGAFTGYHARRAMVHRVGIRDFFVALIEDFVTVAGTLFLVHSFFHAAV